MRIKVRVYFRPRTVKVLLARKDKQWGGQVWLAKRMGVSQAYISLMLSGQEPVPTGRQTKAFDAFRGMSHKPGGRLTWDDLFQSVIDEATGAAGGLR